MKNLMLGAALVLMAVGPAWSMQCNRSIPRGPDQSKLCTDSDIDTGRKGCSPTNCGYGPNDCDIDYSPLCSGLDLRLHQIFGWPANTKPRPGDLVAGEFD